MAQLGPDASGIRTTEGPVDRAIAELASSLDGVLEQADLIAIGVSRWAIKRRVDRGLLIELYPRVYAVGHSALSQRGRHRAALCAAGEQGWLTAFAAIDCWGLGDGRSTRIDIVTRNRSAKPRLGYHLHRPRRLEAHEVTVHKGLRVATVARMLLDMAGLVGDKTLMDLCARAASKGLYDRLAILAVLGRGRRGSRALRRVLATLDVGEGHTKGELEHAFRRLVKRYNITPPVFNMRLHAGGRSLVPDAVWQEPRLVVELDSREFHDNEPGFYNDREKDLIYAELDLDCLRLTWRQVVGEEERVARALICRVGATGP
jgi:hypothetical protein